MADRLADACLDAAAFIEGLANRDAEALRVIEEASSPGDVASLLGVAIVAALEPAERERVTSWLRSEGMVHSV